MQANRKYKDSVFSKYFSDDPKRLIELYNAVSGTHYPEDTEIEINTLDDVLYKDRINDLSFTIDGQLVVLVEHQSTPNENMALRMLIYLGRLYEKILDTEMVYRKKRIAIPEPRFFVLYNGTDELPQHYQQRLSDAFIKKSKSPKIDLVVDVWDINYDASNQLLKESVGLESYSKFVETVRAMKETGLTLGESLKAIICAGNQSKAMQEFLVKYGSEVENMLMTEWKWEDAIKVERKEALEEGLAKGRSEGRLQMLCEMVANGMTKLVDAVKCAGCSESDFKALMHQYYPDFKC